MACVEDPALLAGQPAVAQSVSEGSISASQKTLPPGNKWASQTHSEPGSSQ